MTLDIRNETARGYLLLSVFYLHSVYAFITAQPDPALAPAAFVQIKLLAPQVAVFFVLSGMGAPGLGRRSFSTLLGQSLMLVLLAAMSHVLGALALGAIYGGFETPWTFAKSVIKPLVYGTGYVTALAWFFVVLAIARPLAWLFERNKPLFALIVLAIGACLALAHWRHWPDNLWEWRNWPAATLLFLIGMRIPRGRAIPAWLGLAALVLSLLFTWFNRPGLVETGPCLTCEIEFVAQPMVGQFGFAPLYILQVLLFTVFLLWVSQIRSPHVIADAVTRVGRNSLAYIFMHGFVIAIVFNALDKVFPAHESAPFYVLLLAAVIAFHLALFQVLRRPLEWLIMLCARASRAILAAVER